MSQRGEPASAASAAAAAPVPQGQSVYRQVGRYLYEGDRLIYRISREGEHVPYATYEDDPFAALVGEDEGGWTPGRRTPPTPVTPPESRPRLARSPADLERWRLADERLAREEARQRERQLQPAAAARGGGPSRPFAATPTTMHTQGAGARQPLAHPRMHCPPMAAYAHFMHPMARTQHTRVPIHRVPSPEDDCCWLCSCCRWLAASLCGPQSDNRAYSKKKSCCC
ncbi:unnamed protein product [Vitrella brassicaformis CCMP3155]|uniref:Uncharacterized protein n=2 Tax=Vitrella brassicaformis TaxID=1169539 RepID=A0A0G4GG92_VITBC|nr:unnamed protein product [Vitrella brassicaformis CCMP3155]|eukprot:CEM28634.1 unnamed protein product [Vitrella brassicaformis CCMP3155]